MPCAPCLAHLSVEVVSFAQELAHLESVQDGREVAGRTAGDEVPTMFMSSPGVWRRNLKVAIPTATTRLGPVRRLMRLITLPKAHKPRYHNVTSSYIYKKQKIYNIKSCVF